MADQLFLIGAHKAGTTTLARALDRLPGVELSDPKEPNHYYHEPRPRRDHYLARHWSGRPVRHRLDASTTYSRVGLRPELPERLQADFPTARVLYVVRDPVERIESAWMQDLQQAAPDVVDRDFSAAVREVRRLLESSRYARQLRAYRRAFGPEQVRLVSFAEVTDELPQLLCRLASWLDLDPATVPDHMEIHANPSAGKTRPAPWYEGLRSSLPRLRRSVHRLRRFPPVDRAMVRVAGAAEVPVPRPVWCDEDLARVVAELRDQVEPVAEELDLAPHDWPTWTAAVERFG